jgi:WD40 repeat protein
VRRGARGLSATLAIAACARTPAAKPQVWKDTTNPNAVTAVAFGGDVVYALTYAGRVRIWTGDGRPTRTLALEHVLALADDGSVAVTAAKEGQHGDRVDIWALPALTRLYHHSFEHGIDKVLAVSARAIALLVNTGYTTNPNQGIPQLPPPQWTFELWSFTNDGIGLAGRNERCDEHAVFSTDGRRFVCAKDFGWVSWLDLESGHSASPELAIDWLPPRRSEPEDELGMAPRGPPSISPPPYFLLSVRLGANGDDVFVAYRRMNTDDDGPTRTSPAWRLERWTPAEEAGRGALVRLAATDADVYTQLLAISGDGRLAVLGSHKEPLVVRRAPRYDAQQLAAGASMAAAVSADGRRIVSGHQDGSLRLWDASSGRLLATAASP